MQPKTQAVFDSLVAAALDKQYLLGDFLGDDYTWEFEMATGELRFTLADTSARNRTVFPAQILGTESEESGTWMWSWANEASEIPPALVSTARGLKEWGEREGVEEFVQPRSWTSAIDGHAIALMASGLTEASFYFKGSYENGAAYFLVKDESYRRFAGDPVARIATYFPGMLGSSGLPIADHKAAFTGYLHHFGMAITASSQDGPEGGAIVGTLPDGRSLVGLFDVEGRLEELIAGDAGE